MALATEAVLCSTAGRPYHLKPFGRQEGVIGLERVEDFARGLPSRLREDVLGYARSVQSALPEIFEDAGVRETRELRDQVVFSAGVKKLHAICSSTFWILENSLSGLQQADIRQVRLDYFPVKN